MTDEEMAVNWIRSQGWNEENLPSDEFRQMFQAYLAGLKAGKGMNVPTKWHDLRKDPNDLPKIEIGRTSITVLNEDGNKVYYDYYTKYWRYDDEELHITTPPIAWCEIPKFSE